MSMPSNSMSRNPMSEPPIEPIEPSGPRDPVAGDEILSELFVALTARWRGPEGNLAIGVSARRLIGALGVSAGDLGVLLDRLVERVAPLGLELVEYYHERDRWYVLRSVHPAPTELDEWEQSTLGVVIAMAEETKRGADAAVPGHKIQRLLVRGKYLSLYRLDRALSRLEALGYLVRKKGGYAYGPRTLVEYSEESRKNIHLEARDLVF